MGGALAQALIDASILRSDELLIVEPDQNRREALRETLGCECRDSITHEIADYEFVWLAIKPQGLSALAASLEPMLRESQVLVSILAGIDLSVLRKNFPRLKKFARIMPNTPVQVGKGVSVYFLSSEVSAREASFLHDSLASSGYALQVQDENLVDVATAACASGVGFAFYVLEQFTRAATGLGFSEDQSKELIFETFAGALELWSSSNSSLEELRQAVTSKGGTTAAGVEYLESHRVGEHTRLAIKAAYQRARELSKS